VTWKSVAECAAGMEGDELLKHHGEATDALYPRVSFIPTILLDQVVLGKQCTIMRGGVRNHVLYMGPSISQGKFFFWAVGGGWWWGSVQVLSLQQCG
jgi:hypothetical protein